MEDDNFFGYLLGMLVLVWLVASAGGFIYCIHNNMTAPGLIIIGQLMTVFGLYLVISGIVKRDFQPATLILLVIGVFGLGVGCVKQFCPEESIASVGRSLGWAAIVLFLLLGAVLMVIGVIRYVKEQMTRPRPVDAVCVRIEEKWIDERLLECPVYEFTFQGETLTLTDESSERKNKVEIGDHKEVYVDIYDPTQYGFEKEVEFENIAFITVGLMILLTTAFVAVILYYVG